MSIVAVIHEEMKKRRIRKAKIYVTGDLPQVWGLSGQLQLDLLKEIGCTPNSKVLEIGCGCLNASVPIMKFIEPGNYVGVEPNKWLIDTILEDEEVAELVRTRKPRFLYDASFDATSANTQFDFVISHSVLSHAARPQFELFMRNLRKVLKPSGKILASLRMTGKKGNPLKDSNDSTWVYHSRKKRALMRLLGLKAPRGVSHFSFDTVQAMAAANGFSVVWEKRFREHFTKYSPFEHHDWIVLSPIQSPSRVQGAVVS